MTSDLSNCDRIYEPSVSKNSVEYSFVFSLSVLQHTVQETKTETVLFQYFENSFVREII